MPSSTDATRGAVPPRPRVTSVEITATYDDLGRPERVPLYENTIPSGISTSASLRITFDRFLLSHAVIRQAICLRPSTVEVLSISDCGTPTQPFAAPHYDPVDRSVTYRLPAGARLAADTLYRLTIFVPASEADLGFFAFDGARLDRRYQLDFRTAPPDAEARDEPLPSADAYCAALQCFAPCSSGQLDCDAGCVAAHNACQTACAPDDSPCNEGCTDVLEICSQDCAGAAESCGAPCMRLCVEPSCRSGGDLLAGSPPALFSPCSFSGCHGPFGTTPASGDFLAMGLDLSSLGGLRDTARGHTAHQSHTGEATTVADQRPVRFGRAMPIIDPGAPGNSYLIYKLLINPLNHRRPSGTLDADLFAEIERLRDAFVVGLAMPAQAKSAAASGLASDDPQGQLSFEHARAISAWIANGATLSCP